MSDTTKPMSSLSEIRPSLTRSLLIGGIGFTIVSLAGFSLWAFAGRWFYSNVGEAGLYAASTVVFLGLSGLLLHPLIDSEPKVARFYKIFIPAFLLYAVAWCACWFAWRFGAGEWLGSLLGSVAFASVLGWFFGNFRPLPKVILAFFLVHSAGYFAGDFAMKHFTPSDLPFLDGLSRRTLGTLAKLAWGLCYGAGFGVGLGYAFFALQKATGAREAKDSRPA